MTFEDRFRLAKIDWLKFRIALWNRKADEEPAFRWAYELKAEFYGADLREELAHLNPTSISQIR